VERSRFIVSSTGSMRESHPIQGFRSSLDKASRSQVGAQCCGFGGLVAKGVGLPYSTLK